MNADDRLDRTTNPDLHGFFDALDELVAPPADPALRSQQIQRAALLARSAGPAPASPVLWSWRRAATWRVAAAAAAVAVVAGLGADDRLPTPAQRAVSSVADVVGIDVPDGSERERPAERDGDPGSSRRSGTVPAIPADPRGPGVPATPATPADPDAPGRDAEPPGKPTEGDEPGPQPATPADPGEPGAPATPATPAPGDGSLLESKGNDKPDSPPAGSKADPKGHAVGQQSESDP